MKHIISYTAIQASLALWGISEAFAASGHAPAGHASDAFHGVVTDTIDPHAIDPHAGEAHDAAHGAGHAGEHAATGLPQLDASWYASQIFWLAIVFLVLYFIFSKKVLPELSSTIDGRNERIQGDLEEAQKLKDEAEKVHQAYEEILDEARRKSSDAFSNVDEAIKAKTEKSMIKFREKSLSKTQDAESAVAKAKKAAMKDMDNVAAEVAREAAEKIIGIPTDIKKAKTVVESLSKKAA